MQGENSGLPKVATITISKLEYEILIRENERLETFKSYVRNHEYIDKSVAVTLLNIKEG